MCPSESLNLSYNLEIVEIESSLEACHLNKYMIKGQGLSTKNTKLRGISLLLSADMGQDLLGHIRTSLNLEEKKKELLIDEYTSSVRH